MTGGVSLLNIFPLLRNSKIFNNSNELKTQAFLILTNRQKKKEKIKPREKEVREGGKASHSIYKARVMATMKHHCRLLFVSWEKIF